MTEEQNPSPLSDPEQLRSFPTIEILMGWVDMAQKEVADRAGDRRGKWEYPALAVLQMQVHSHAIDYPDRLSIYEKEEARINSLYGNVIGKNYRMKNEEADLRLRNALSLAHDIGPLRIDPKYAYYRGRSPDFIDFTAWRDE